MKRVWHLLAKSEPHAPWTSILLLPQELPGLGDFVQGYCLTILEVRGLK